MQPLPEQDYEYAEWRFARVGIDYHVEVAGFLLLGAARVAPRAGRYPPDDAHDRDVPPRQAGRRAMRGVTAVRGTARCPTTCRARTGVMPNGSPERFQRQARAIGPNTEALILAVLAHRPHPEQGFRTCLGVLRLFRGLDAARAEAISRRAVEIGALTYNSVASILQHRLDQSAPPQAADGTPILHANIRGPRYFH